MRHEPPPKESAGVAAGALGNQNRVGQSSYTPPNPLRQVAVLEQVADWKDDLRLRLGRAVNDPYTTREEIERLADEVRQFTGMCRALAKRA